MIILDFAESISRFFLSKGRERWRRRTMTFNYAVVLKIFKTRDPIDCMVQTAAKSESAHPRTSLRLDALKLVESQLTADLWMHVVRSVNVNEKLGRGSHLRLSLTLRSARLVIRSLLSVLHTNLALDSPSAETATQYSICFPLVSASKQYLRK